MKTILLDVRNQSCYWNNIKTAAKALREGELVAFPTETVYGLGVHRDNEEAVSRIFAAKKRIEDKRLTLMIADFKELEEYVDNISQTAKKLIHCFWPGALAIIFPLNNGSDISIRLPDNTVARDLIRTAKVPVVTTSANISGNPPATDAQQVLMDLDGKIPMILDSGSTKLRSPSTIVKVRDDTVEVVRHGVISEVVIGNCLMGNLVRL